MKATFSREMLRSSLLSSNVFVFVRMRKERWEGRTQIRENQECQGPDAAMAGGEAAQTTQRPSGRGMARLTLGIREGNRGKDNGTVGRHRFQRAERT